MTLESDSSGIYYFEIKSIMMVADLNSDMSINIYNGAFMFREKLVQFVNIAYSFKCDDARYDDEYMMFEYFLN